MSRQTLNITDELHSYLISVSTRETKEQEALRQENANHPYASMQISPEQGQFLQLLVKMLGSEKIIELGVFTGYSSLCMALALPPNGQIIACDVSKEYTDIARSYWHRAGVADKIDLRLAPGLDTLNQLLDSGQAGSFDLIFTDAVKEEYQDYYELGLKLLRPGGVITIDNVLWSGAVVDPSNQTSETVAIRELNQHVHDDDRVDMCMLPLGDGLTLARKR